MIRRALHVLSVSTIAAILFSHVGLVPVAQAKGEDVCPEPNDDFQSACYLGPGSDALGFISHPDDIDAYRFEALDFGTRAHVEIAEQPAPYQFVVANWNGDPIATSTSDGAREVADVELPIPGSYYLFVQSRSGRFSDSQSYRVLTRLEYPTPVPPRATYRGDFRAGSADKEDATETSEFRRSEGKVTIVGKVAGTPSQPRRVGFWLASRTPDRFALAFDSRITSGSTAGYMLRFGAVEPATEGGTRSGGLALRVDAHRGRAQLGQYVGSSYTSLTSWLPAPSVAVDGRVNRTVLQVGDGLVRVTVNGGEVLTWNGAVPAGQFAVGSLSWGDPATVSFDNVLLTVPGEAAPVAGSVLLAEHFDGTNRSSLPITTSRSEAAGVFRDVVDGEYRVRLARPDGSTNGGATALPFTYADAAVSVDVRIVGDPVGQYTGVDCRSQPPQAGVGASGYRLYLYPANGQFSLSRWDNGIPTSLTSRQSSKAIKRGNEVNRLELECRGTTITAKVNGVEVATVEDATYRDGRIVLGVGYSPDTPTHEAEVRFDNLVVTQR